MDTTYQPATELWSMYDPSAAPYAFRASNRDAAEEWQQATRAALAQLIGLEKLGLSKDPPEAEVLSSVDKGDYTRLKIVLRTSPTTSMPVYLLLPKAATSPSAVVLALHGHGYGAKDIVGLWEDGTERDTPDGYQRDFAVALCRAGFAVAAPEISCFGERQTDFSYLKADFGQTAPTTCAHTAFLAMHLGVTALGIRVRDAMRLVDYLSAVPEIDVSRLGVMGISGGGMHALFSACLDTRIQACAVSGYFSTFRESVLAMQHCACNFVPGLAAFGEMYDLAGLVAPRPLLVEAGSRDPIFPIAAVRYAVNRARELYRVFDDRSVYPLTDLFEGRHRINGVEAARFLRCLTGD